MSKGLAVFLGVVVAVIIAGVVAMPDAAPVPAAKPAADGPQGLVLLDEPAGKIGAGFIVITGRVRNNSPKPIGYANINFTILNGEGEQVGTAIDAVSNLEAGAVWKFRAVSMRPGGVRFKLAKISSVP